MVDSNNVGPWLLNTIQNDKNLTREEALIDIYRVMRPGEPPAMKVLKHCFRIYFLTKDMISQQLVELRCRQG